MWNYSPLVLHQWTGLHSHWVQVLQNTCLKSVAQSVSFFHIFFILKNWFMVFHNWANWTLISIRLKFWGISHFSSLWRIIRMPGIAWSTSWGAQRFPPIRPWCQYRSQVRTNLTSLIWPSNLGYRHLVHYVVELIDCCLNLKSPPFLVLWLSA